MFVENKWYVFLILAISRITFTCSCVLTVPACEVLSVHERTTIPDLIPLIPCAHKSPIHIVKNLLHYNRNRQQHAVFWKMFCTYKKFVCALVHLNMGTLVWSCQVDSAVLPMYRPTFFSWHFSMVWLSCTKVSSVSHRCSANITSQTPTWINLRVRYQGTWDRRLVHTWYLPHE